MTVGRYLIAGLRVEMNVWYELLKSRCEKYRYDFDGEPDIVINTTAEQIQASKADNPGTSDEMIEYIGSGCMFYIKLLSFSGFLLHSSCISHNGRAYIFSADCGTGKSTHTSLWKKYIDGVEYINDDKPAVRMIDGKFCAMGTPWSGKTALNNDVAVPLGGAVLLYRGKENTIRRATADEAIPFIMRQTIMPVNAERTELLVDLLDKFLTEIPTYHLECDMSEQAVKTSFEALTNEKYIKRKNEND